MPRCGEFVRERVARGGDAEVAFEGGVGEEVGKENGVEAFHYQARRDGHGPEDGFGIRADALAEDHGVFGSIGVCGGSSGSGRG